jgi:hypothetical protein
VKKIFMGFLLMLGSSRAVATPLFLRLAGSVGAHNPSQILSDFTRIVVNPLGQGATFTRQSFVANVAGSVSFHFNFIVEALDVSTESDFQNYVANLEGQDFYGAKIHFEKVASLTETAALQAGRYDSQREDPFDMNFQILKKFNFTSLRDWLNFSNTYGFALLSPNHSTFRDYLKGFLNDAGDFQNVSRVLSQNNMVAIDPRVNVILEDGTLIPSDMQHSPFLPFKFFRNCFQPQFEIGNCAK